MSEDNKPEEKKEPERTPEQVAADLAELKTLKEQFGSVTVTIKGKPSKLNLLAKEEFEKAVQFMAGGATFAQDKATFNAEVAAFKKSKEKAEAEIKAKLDADGKPADSKAVGKRYSELLKANAGLKQKLEDGDPTFVDDLGAILDEAAPVSTEQPKSAGGVTGDYVDRQIAMRTQILPDPKFQLLATKLGRGDSALGAKKIAEEFKRQVETGTVPADADFAQSYLSVAHAYADELGLKVEAAKPEEKAEEAEPGKENPPKGGGAGAGPGAGPEVPKFKHYDDFLKWKLEKEKKGGNRQHSWRDV